MAVTDAVMPLAERLLNCLCAQLPGTVGGAACRCCVYPGATVPVDHCCGCEEGEGQAWVQVRRIYPTTAARFPQPSTTLEPCDAAGGWGMELVMGVYRCVSVLDDQGNPPSCADVFDDAEKLLSDAAAMRQALACCFPYTGNDGLDVMAGEYTPMGPDGGCAGGQQTVYVRFTECCPDPEDTP
ncbi:hypothetical protein [Thermomonospora cellulosilytica]|uniref:Uncharacterized protein n=1 Tax=Thermomonospora cellulosilytica TaxID=1411118 RepID=A0A7W3N1U0_9ACTN|nr:hypothetical protein [Thermomonospora cellulosilytica]MBA9005943.1 hypothetical protein [Thermomonospora cellulosilytica]